MTIGPAPGPCDDEPDHEERTDEEDGVPGTEAAGTDPSAGWLLAFLDDELTPQRTDAWVAVTTDAILTALPELAGDEELSDLVRGTVAEQWRAFLHTTRAHLTGADPRTASDFELPPAAAELATAMARHRIELPALLTAYRIAQREAWTYATAVLSAAPPEVDRAGLLVEVWGRAGQWLDASTEASILVHAEERRRLQRSGAARRYDAIHRLLDGEVTDPHELSAQLDGYPVSDHHVALVLRALTADAIGGLEPTALSLAGRISPGTPLLVEPGGHELWCWVASRSVPDLTTGCRLRSGVRVGIGGPARGMDGILTAHQDARAAVGVALASRAAEADLPTHYDDVAALALLAADPAAAERFTRRTLRGLADDDPSTARLRATVLAVLRGGSSEEVADLLGVHKNTVRYRVGQAEELIGHPIGCRRGDLELALRYFETFLAP